MARRSAEWNEGLSKDLRDNNFARGFILTALENGITLQEVLGKVIRAYGVKEFAAKIKVPSSNLLRAISPEANPTIETLDLILKPFGMQTSAMASVKKRRA